MLYVLQLWSIASRVYGIIVAQNTRIVRKSDLKKVKFCILYNNFGFRPI